MYFKETYYKGIMSMILSRQKKAMEEVIGFLVCVALLCVQNKQKAWCDYFS